MYHLPQRPDGSDSLLLLSLLLFLPLLIAQGGCGSDLDEDGWSEADGDCDDDDPNTYPDAEELCDDKDNDCDGEVDDELPEYEGYLDADGDGYGEGNAPVTICTLEGYVEQGGDCDDDDPEINPAEEDICDGIDNNCDGAVDDGLTFQDLFIDADGDGYGVGEAVSTCETAGYAEQDGDCDDTDASIHPEAKELCDDLDNNCDGQVDEGLEVVTNYKDLDEDGYGTDDTAVLDCALDWYARVGGDCDDHDAYVNPAATDVCNFYEENMYGENIYGEAGEPIDDDCNGVANEVVNWGWYPDEDGDGIGANEGLVESCEQPAGYVRFPGDCDDTDPLVSPVELEVCDGIDRDCNGYIDDRSNLSWFPDDDGDGYGVSEHEVKQCAPIEGFVGARGDCDDSDPSVYPGADDPTGGADQDCGGTENSDPHVGLGSNSWSSIYEALEAAQDGMTVWVGPGTYYESQLYFLGKAVALMSTHLADETIVVGSEPGTRVFGFSDGEGPDTVLDGFQTRFSGEFTPGGGGGANSIAAVTIGGGTSAEDGSSPLIRGCKFVGQHPEGSVDVTEYGLIIGSGHPTIEDCVITGMKNSHIDAVDGVNVIAAGAYISNASVTFVNTVFSKNEVRVEVAKTDADTNAVGAGLYVTDSALEMRGCTIIGNSAIGIGGPWAEGWAGGLLVVAYQEVMIIENTTIAYNTATDLTGGVSVVGQTLLMRNVQLVHNAAGISVGGGHLSGSEVTLENVHVDRNFSAGAAAGLHVDPFWICELSNIRVTGNTSGREAGGLKLDAGGDVCHLENVAVVGNSAAVGGGVLFDPYDGQTNSAVNSDFSFNVGGNLYGTPWGDGSYEFSHSNLYALSGMTNHNFGILESTNLSVDPQYMRTEGPGQNLHLAPTSPLVNAGDPGRLDPDGSLSDIGVFGGILADRFDLDLDEYPDYFWPGTIDDVPTGFEPTDYDSNDLDPMIH